MPGHFEGDFVRPGGEKSETAVQVLGGGVVARDAQTEVRASFPGPRLSLAESRAGDSLPLEPGQDGDIHNAEAARNRPRMAGSWRFTVSRPREEHAARVFPVFAGQNPIFRRRVRSRPGKLAGGVLHGQELIAEIRGQQVEFGVGVDEEAAQEGVVRRSGRAECAGCGGLEQSGQRIS